MYKLSAELEFIDTDIVANSSDFTGGGVLASRGSLIFDGGQVVGNDASDNGGGLYTLNATAIITDAVFRENSAGFWVEDCKFAEAQPRSKTLSSMITQQGSTAVASTSTDRIRASHFLMLSWKTTLLVTEAVSRTRVHRCRCPIPLLPITTQNLAAESSISSAVSQ